jgi:hypothetical protein
MEEERALSDAPAAPRPPVIGQPAPGFLLASIAGRPMRLAEFRGRRVILWLSRGIY